MDEGKVGERSIGEVTIPRQIREKIGASCWHEQIVAKASILPFLRRFEVRRSTLETSPTVDGIVAMALLFVPTGSGSKSK